MRRFLIPLLIPLTLHAQERIRARTMGVAPGIYQPGPHNAITDVPGVRVGHATLRPRRLDPDRGHRDPSA